MPQPRKAAAPTRGAAARAETTGDTKTIDFRGVTLTLPPVLPGTLYFDLAELQDNQGDLGAQLRVLRSLLGSDQVAAIRDKVHADNVSFDEVIGVMLDLFDAIVGAYGTDPGESAASPAS